MMEKLFIIKVGGNVIDNDTLLRSFLSRLAAADVKAVLIHGGGKIATRIGDKLGIVSRYVEGRRITDAETVDLVTMVYGGLVNKKIVASLQASDCNAIGLTGADADIIPAGRRPVKDTDYGFVGDITPGAVKTEFLKLLLDKGLLPVIAPLTHDGKGQLLNTNADTIASALAIGLSAHFSVRLIYCFEKKGVLEDVEREDSVIPLITPGSYRQLKAQNRLFDGILPKIDNAFAAIEAGVEEVLIGDANDLLQNLTKEVKGTLIKSN